MSVSAVPEEQQPNGKTGFSLISWFKDTGSFFLLFARFAKLSLRYWDKLLVQIVMSQVIGMMWILSGMAMGNCVDEGLRLGNKDSFFQWCSLWIAAQFILLAMFTITTFMSAYIKARVEYRLKMNVFDHFQKLSLRFHQKRPIGENMFRLNNDTMLSATVAAAAIPDTLSRLVAVATTATLLFALNSKVAIAVFLYIIIYYLYSHFITTFCTKYENDKRLTGQAMTAMYQENLSAYVISKGMSRERHESRRFFGRVADFARASMRYGVCFGLVMEGLRGIWDIFLYLVQMLFCGWLVTQGVFTIGEYVAIGQILFFIIGPMQVLIQMIIWFRVSAVTLRRLLQTLDVKPEIEDSPVAAKLKDPEGEIVFENVNFRYTPDGEDVIKDLSFRVPPGKKLAIVGSSGAGKTTIFNLIMRYYDPTGGKVLIDGKELSELQLDSYREHLSIVLQDNFMYSATIKDNIKFGKPDASEEEVNRAVELAGLGPMLKSMPNGIDTILKEGGDLSSGQLQRIGIARAVIRDPKFLFLDEATSSLDPVTEAEILEQLRKVEKGRTRLVIAHNIVSVRDSDEILVMSQGVCVQRGIHKDLVAQEGLYKTMWEAELEKMDNRQPVGETE